MEKWENIFGKMARFGDDIPLVSEEKFQKRLRDIQDNPNLFETNTAKSAVSTCKTIVKHAKNTWGWNPAQTCSKMELVST